MEASHTKATNHIYSYNTESYSQLAVSFSCKTDLPFNTVICECSKQHEVTDEQFRRHQTAWTVGVLFGKTAKLFNVLQRKQSQRAWRYKPETDKHISQDEEWLECEAHWPGRLIFKGWSAILLHSAHVWQHFMKYLWCILKLVWRQMVACLLFRPLLYMCI